MLAEIASAGEDGVLAGIENSAIGGIKGQLFEFFVQSEEATNQGFTMGGNFNRNGGGHKTSLFEWAHRVYLNCAIATREVSYTR